MVKVLSFFTLCYLVDGVHLPPLVAIIAERRYIVNFILTVHRDHER